MELYDKAYLAVLNVRKAHFEMELRDYTQVMKYYSPEIKAFDYIISEIERITGNISALEQEIAKV